MRCQSSWRSRTALAFAGVLRRCRFRRLGACYGCASGKGQENQAKLGGVRLGVTCVLVLLVSACDERAEPQGHQLVSASSAARPSAPSAARSGVFTLDRDTRSWRRSSGGLPEAVVVTEFAEQGGRVFAATGSHGLWQSDDAGQTWRRAESCKVTQLNAVAARDGMVLVGTLSQGVVLSQDRGETWVSANQGLKNLKTRRLLATAESVLLGTNSGLYRYEDAGQRWSHLTGDAQVKGIVALGKELYMGDVHGVQRSSDGGAHWKQVLTETPHNLAGIGGDVYALLYAGGVKRSSDRGETWSDVSHGLPALYTFQILGTPHGALAAQWDGVYALEEGTQEWLPLRDGLPSETAITDLLPLPSGRLLAAAVPSKTN
ncbi:MAG: hypothetical protein KC492_28505 [Myxococcales bacterium]|nr:hypothetical protein [Myxococcales bacterium]